MKTLYLSRKDFIKKDRPHFLEDMQRFFHVSDIVKEEICHMLGFAKHDPIGECINAWSHSIKITLKLILDYFKVTINELEVGPIRLVDKNKFKGLDQDEIDQLLFDDEISDLEQKSTYREGTATHSRNHGKIFIEESYDLAIT